MSKEQSDIVERLRAENADPRTDLQISMIFR